MSDKIVLALGYFDCVHIAHQEVLKAASDLAKKMNAKSAAITFENNIKKTPYIYDVGKRVHSMLKYCDEVITYKFDSSFADQTPSEFLLNMFIRYNVCGFVCGYDYRFGKNAEGNVKTLSDFCRKKKLALTVVDNFYSLGKSVSSTYIKRLLTCGEIEKANRLLGAPYCICGKVIHGRGEGHLFGFPTANLLQKTGKIALKSGVYSTMSDINGKTFNSVTNIGSKPTFNDMSVSIETFIQGYSGDLYNKTINLFFYKYLRDIKKFDSVDELKKQILVDIGR